jgi:hypothetical protein
MDYWGIKSYENDLAHDALDAGFDRVHGDRYEELMDDRNPLTYEQVQEQLASPQTFAAALAALHDEIGDAREPDQWDEWARLALVGIAVRHAEIGVPIPATWLERAIDWLEHEDIEWDEPTKRRLRIGKEIACLRRAKPADAG